MTPQTIARMLSELRVLRFFPHDEYVMNALVRLCGAMCTDEKQVRWLVDRMTSGIYSEWPGPQEMRACFCSRFKPKDGIDISSSVYPDGFPRDPNLIAPPELKALPTPRRKLTP